MFRCRTLILSILSILIILILTSFGKTPEKQDKLILVSFDGAEHKLIQKYYEETTEGFGKIFKKGLLAEKNIIVTPSLTAVSHISMITGEYPNKTGIVSNSFHHVTDDIHETKVGFSAPIEAPTLWEIAKKQGKKVGIISYPGADASGKTEEEIEKRKGTFGIPFPQSLNDPSIVEFKEEHFTKLQKIKLPPSMKTFSSPYMTSAFLDDTPQKKKLFITLLDTTDDDDKNYDLVVVDEDHNLNNGVLALARTGEWFKILYTSQKQQRLSYSKIVTLQSQPTYLKIYWGALSTHKAYPESFENLLESRLEPPAGGPDNFRLHVALTEEDYLTQTLRFNEYFKKVTEIVIQEMEWDILLLYFPATDELGHQFYLKDSKQMGYSAEKEKQYADYLKKGYDFIQEVTRNLVHYVDKATHKISLMIVSDHGMAPLHTLAYPNRVLHRLDIEENGARAVSSGGTSHVYINLEGRQKNGTVDQNQFESYKQKIVKIFKELKHPKHGLVFEHILSTQKDFEKFHLDHRENTGDVVLISKPGYHLTDASYDGDLFVPAPFYGQHGYDSNDPSMAAIFYRYDRSLQYEKIPSIHSTHIFNLIKSILSLK